MKKREGELFIFGIFILVFFLIFFVSATENATGVVSFEIEAPPEINISSPLNITYNFTGITNAWGPFILDLNVSANFIVNTWEYSLWDLTKNVEVWPSTVFFPNESLSSVKGSNHLFVNASKLSNGEVVSAEVIFFVHFDNTDPFLTGLNDTIYVCEGGTLNYLFNATDYDEDALEVKIVPTIPTTPFYIEPWFFVAGTGFFHNPVLKSEEPITKSRLNGPDTGFKIYPELISVEDGVPGHVDTKNLNLVVIEINNPPLFENLTTQTIWNHGDNTTFYHETEVNDIENGNATDGNLEFSLSIIDPFGAPSNLLAISPIGVMNFTATETTPLGVYNITVCANDTGLTNPFVNISQECGQDGSMIEECMNFSLTITDRNRAPTIINFNPKNITVNASGGDTLHFNITKYDPDGTIPDTYWDLDELLLEADYGSSGNLTDTLDWIIPCDFGGKHILGVEITDGLLNDTLNWTLNIQSKACAVEGDDGGGGGGGGGPFCKSEWVCGEWGICQGAENSLDFGILSGEDYRNISDQCIENNYGVKSCGFQTKYCTDLKNCSTSYGKPNDIQACFYVENPTCEDGVKNCHHGGCELLIDCGGPCGDCATCSDGLKNQGEGGIDCGGPCPWKCEEEKPLLKRNTTLYAIIMVILIIAILAVLKIIQIVRMKKRLSSTPSIGNSLR